MNKPAIRTVKIKGKDYVDVAERVRLCHADDGFSMLKEEYLEIVGQHIIRVYIDVKGKQYIGDAEIKVNAKPGSADGDSPISCAQTSALGRALGFASYGSVESIASADEVARNDEPTAQPPKDYIPINAPTPRELRERHAFLKMNDDFETIKMKKFGRKITDGELTPEQCITISGVLERFYEKNAKSA